MKTITLKNIDITQLRSGFSMPDNGSRQTASVEVVLIVHEYALALAITKLLKAYDKPEDIHLGAFHNLTGTGEYVSGCVKVDRHPAEYVKWYDVTIEWERTYYNYNYTDEESGALLKRMEDDAVADLIAIDGELGRMKAAMDVVNLMLIANKVEMKVGGVKA